MPADQQVPSRQVSSQQKQSERRLVKAIAATVAAVMAAELAKSSLKAPMKDAGISAAGVTGAVTRTLTMSALIVHSMVRRFARVLVNDNTAQPIDQNLIEQMVAHELVYEQLYSEKAARRIATGIVRALQTGTTPQEVRQAYDEAVQRLTANEKRIFDLRLNAVQQRIYRRVDEAGVQTDSPAGAYWLLDPSKATHTKDCVVMSNHAWSWGVLDLIRPSNRHVGCGCKLITLQAARAAAMPNAGTVQTSVPELAMAATNG